MIKFVLKKWFWKNTARLLNHHSGDFNVTVNIELYRPIYLIWVNKTLTGSLEMQFPGCRWQHNLSLRVGISLQLVQTHHDGCVGPPSDGLCPCSGSIILKRYSGFSRTTLLRVSLISSGDNASTFIYKNTAHTKKTAPYQLELIVQCINCQTCAIYTWEKTPAKVSLFYLYVSSSFL
jgi:hypothetical protein